MLVLRPEPGASVTVARARELGLDPVSVPLFHVEAIDWTAPDPAAFDGVLLTSANAIRHGEQQLKKLRGMKAYAVGQATADAALDAGFEVAAFGQAGVDRLLGSIEADLRLLHLCGTDRHEPDAARQEIVPIPVYRASAIEEANVSPYSRCVALLHSPRAARRFAALVHRRDGIALAAISEAAADAAGEGWLSVDVADAPSDEALLALAARLCDKPPPK